MWFHAKFQLPSLYDVWVLAILNFWPPRSRSRQGLRSNSRSGLVRGYLSVFPCQISVRRKFTWIDENVFKNKNIPFRSFEIYKRDEKTLGELFCFFILETILIGQSMNLNPYDQPAVELIKVETKKLLVKST